MRIGVPKEVKADEHRVALTPAGVRELVDAGHEVVVERGAGAECGIADADYAAQGAALAPTADAVYADARLIVKVKEPTPQEVARLRPHHVLFTYLHLAPAPELTRALMATGATCIAYETVEDAHGRLPLLAPMSEVAGKLATQVGASLLERQRGGAGVLLGGVPGVPPATVLVIGAGVVGVSAAAVALGMGATVVVYDRDLARLRALDGRFGGRVQTCFASALAIEQRLADADLVIGAVLIAGARAPHVISRAQLARMRTGAVLVDVAIDQGGCFETSRPTTHREPTYVVDGITHYCVTNMPAAVPVTATHALTNATLPYVVALARDDVQGAVRADPGLARGVNVVAGQATYAPVAEAAGVPYVPLADALGTLQSA